MRNKMGKKMGATSRARDVWGGGKVGADTNTRGNVSQRERSRNGELLLL